MSAAVSERQKTQISMDMSVEAVTVCCKANSISVCMYQQLDMTLPFEIRCESIKCPSLSTFKILMYQSFILTQQGLYSMCIQGDGALSFGMPKVYHKRHFGSIVHREPVPQLQVISCT